MGVYGGKLFIAGGQKIETGLDQNRNNSLDANEVSNTSYVCHGEAGADGSDGADGKNSLIEIVGEAPGVNCPDGGKRIYTGLDANQNGLLEVVEISKTSYLCTPKAGSGGGCSTEGFAGSWLALVAMFFGLAVQGQKRRGKK